VRTVSITRRLTLAVLALEVFCAIALIGAIAVEERQAELEAFDATLKGTADSIMGSVQDANNDTRDATLDLRGLQLGKNAVFRVEDERGKVIGSSGDVPEQILVSMHDNPSFRNGRLKGHNYRFVIRFGIRVLDARGATGAVRRIITIVYGTPVDHVWHEVFEAIRFFAIATAAVLGITALGMVWILRRELSPLRELAQRAEAISTETWQFEAPASAKKTKELRPLAQALEAALGRLQRSFEQQRRFTSDAAHELKTDVAIVKSSLQLLSMRKRSVEEYGRGLALSLDDFTRLEMTVQTMLTLARLEQPREFNGVDSVRRVCSLRDAVEEAVHKSRALAELKHVDIKVDFGLDPQIPIDRRDAILLCSNVLVNALQHSPAHATVQIQVIGEGDTVCLTVRDEGEGIANEDRPYIFEPFYRGDPSRSRKSGGTGLGLSICKAICERAGGTIQISNCSPTGALVKITLPVEPMVLDQVNSASI
jgi:two-component system OmpR family sensor kinase